MKNKDIIKDAEDGRLKKKTVKALKEKLSNKANKTAYENKGITSHEEALVYAKEHNISTDQAFKRLSNRD